MKEKLLKLLKAKEEARAKLVAKSEKSEDVTELRSIQTQIDGLNGEMDELRSMIDAIQDEPDARTTAVAGAEQRSFVPGKGFTASPEGQQKKEERKDEDPYASLEYRKAFMDFCKTGALPEKRIDAMTAITDVSAVIPSTILNEVIKKVLVYGKVFARVRKLAVKGGISIPILSLKPTATWIGETTTSDKKKMQANTSVIFAYYGLECKVSTSLLADTVTLTGFETVIIEAITEAMVIAIESAIVNGVGTTQALGITKDTRVPVAQVVTLASADFLDWGAWKKKVFAKMPLGYKAGACFLMASGTFEGYIDGMTDANGQPIGRVNYGVADGPQERFGGKEVLLVEDDIIAAYDDAGVGDVVAVYCKLGDYAINSNMQMSMFRYLDHDTNEWIDKAILIMDGKLLDPNGAVVIKKGA